MQQVSGDFAPSLYQCLRYFAEQKSNPVLKILTGEARVYESRHYPEQGILIAGGLIKAFYHSHQSTMDDDREHGHFHVFYRSGNDVEPLWAHIAGLSIDRQGQPLYWFVVNRWVTDGEFLDSAFLERLFAELQPCPKSEDMVAAWLENMLGLFQEDLTVLYQQRDARMGDLECEKVKEKIFEDRSIYLLAKTPARILDKFS